jgi:hypothetical protein
LVNELVAFKLEGPKRVELMLAPMVWVESLPPKEIAARAVVLRSRGAVPERVATLAEIPVTGI